MTKKIYLYVSGAIFAFVAVLHLARLAGGWEFRFGPWSVPLWASWIGFAVMGALALWALRLNKS